MGRIRSRFRAIAAGAVLLGATSAAVSAPLFFQSFPAPNLIAYYPLDETAVGTAADASGGGFNGTHVDNPTPSTDVPTLAFNTAASRSLGFTDTGSTGTTGDRVTLPNAMLNGKTNLTVSFWMKSAKMTDEQTIISAANAAQTNEWILLVQTGTIFRYVEKGTSYNTSGLPTLVDNAWHHVAVTRNQTGNSVTLYTDGVSRISFTPTTALTAISVAAGGLVLGEEQDAVGGGFQVIQALSGLLDDVRFYDRVLTAPEVAYLAAGNGPPPAPSLTSATGGMNPGTGQPQVDLVWAAVTTTPATPVTYTVLRGPTLGGPYPTQVATGLMGTTYSDTMGLTFGTTYYYVVRATNVGGTSADSNELPGTPQLPPPRTNDHEEGFVDSNCGCGSVTPRVPWLAALLVLAVWVTVRSMKQAVFKMIK